MSKLKFCVFCISELGNFELHATLVQFLMNTLQIKIRTRLLEFFGGLLRNKDVTGSPPFPSSVNQHSLLKGKFFRLKFSYTCMYVQLELAIRVKIMYFESTDLYVVGDKSSRNGFSFTDKKTL